MAQLTCPTCHRPFDSTRSDAMPFCCERCRLVDLHRWLNETNTLTVIHEDDDGEGLMTDE
ncbi:MAG: DNA gyrase inhibitor YacG [Planctomycetaceae bacterium]|nr:DNA gyrase inhibitor YacG [Planctomycetaceae bacterium]